MLNKNEKAVLEGCVQAIQWCTKGEFGFTDDVKVVGLTDNQIKGYLSQLQKKNYIFIDQDDCQGQMNITQTAVEQFGVEFNCMDFSTI